MSYLESQCITLEFCTVWYKITTGHKNQTQSYKRYKFHLLPNGNSFLVDQPHQGKGWHLLCPLAKEGQGCRIPQGSPALMHHWICLFPGMTACASAHIPPASSDQEIAAIPAVYLCGDSSNHMVTPTKSKCPLQSPPFRQNYHHQAFRAYQVIYGTAQK